MVLTRYQIRNEYGLASKKLYQSANEDDAEALFEGSSMAGLVGVLRQLGDLAEFAAEVFHCLHEELKTTAARGYGLAMRLQQLEAEFPSIEIPILSQIDHSTFFYEPGLKKHYNLHTEENLISSRNLPHCIMDSYEECRGPPQLFLLDKFDVAGSGSCLNRYSDPSLLKKLTASAVVATSNHNKDERPRKPTLQKKELHTTSGETSGDSRTSHSKLHQLFFLEHVENKHINPEFHVKLKRRLLSGHQINLSPGTCYMEKFLKSSLPHCDRVHKTLDQSCPAIEAEVTVCSIQEDLPIPFLVDPNSGDHTMKNNEMAMESIPDDERLEVPFTPYEVTINEKSLPQEEGGPTACLERSSSVNLCSKAKNDANAPSSTESEANKTDSDEKAGIQQCLSLGCCMQKQDQGQENSSEMAMESIPDDERLEVPFTIHEVTINEKSLPQVEGGPTACLERSSSVNLCSKADNDANAESELESPITVSVESLPTEDGPVGVQGSPCQEALICNEKFSPSCITEVEALHPPLQGETLTSINDHIDKSVLSRDLIDEEDCLDMSPESMVAFSTYIHEIPQADPEIMPPIQPLTPDEEDCLDISPESMIAFSTSIHETSQADSEITPPLPPLPPTQWWMGKLVESTEMSSLAGGENNSIYIDHMDENTHDGLVKATKAQYPSEALVSDDENQNYCGYRKESTVEAASICEQTNLDIPSIATEERSLSAVDGTSDTYLHDDESTLQSLNKTVEAPFAEEISPGGIEGDWRTEAMALKWFSQNLREHTSPPHHANLKEESQLGNPLETELPQTLPDSNSYDQNQKDGNLEKDKGSPVIGIDRSMLRKVSERNMTQVGARVDENDSLLEIIRSKSFNLRPTYASGRLNFQVNVPKPNLKVAAILEKANTLRQAMAGSDDEHDSGNWSD